jgi:very-short-patch-repair endonuclease
LYALFSSRGNGSVVKLTKEDITFFKPKKRSIFGKNEEKCRDILQELFKKPFPSCRPSFLRNPITGKNLELDCYNEELKLALEYDGIQHYTNSKFFYKTNNDFHNQVRRDHFKTNRLKELGIDLIRVPYYIKTYDLKRYIQEQCRKLRKDSHFVS